MKPCLYAAGAESRVNREDPRRAGSGERHHSPQEDYENVSFASAVYACVKSYVLGHVALFEGVLRWEGGDGKAFAEFRRKDGT